MFPYFDSKVWDRGVVYFTFTFNGNKAGFYLYPEEAISMGEAMLRAADMAKLEHPRG